MSKQNLEALKQVAMPVIEYLCEHHHPHVVVVITPTSVELLEGVMSIPKIYDHVKD